MAAPWFSPRPTLIVVPGRPGGHVLALEESECSGWPTLALDNDLAVNFDLASDDGDRLMGIPPCETRYPTPPAPGCLHSLRWP